MFFEKHGTHLKKAGASLQGKCLFHKEQNGQALTVWPAENRWHCFGKCQRGGDVIDATMILHGIDFQSACELLATGKVTSIAQLPALANFLRRPPVSPILTPNQIKEQDAACRALRDCPERIGVVANHRHWQPETILHLAMDGHLGLHHGSLAFIYNHGLKYRWDQNGQRRVAWAFGGNRELWRDDRLWPSEVRTIYICEGETDAISLIDAGIENYPTTAVVAIPCANAWEPSWNIHFRNRDVVILTDADPAGDLAATRITRQLQDGAARVVRLRAPDLAQHDTQSVSTL